MRAYLGQNQFVVGGVAHLIWLIVPRIQNKGLSTVSQKRCV